MIISKHAGEVLRTYFLETKETIAVAESVTSGLLQCELSNLTDALQFFQGGITAYNVGQKYRHLLVEPIHALAYNCVSAKVAEEMALNVCTLFHSNWGIGITGYATPVPESANEIYCNFCIVQNGAVQTAGRIDGKGLTARKVQACYVAEVLRRMARHLEKEID